MKKLVLTIALLVSTLALSLGVSAQVRYGLVGGFTSSSAEAITQFKTTNVNLYHAGVAAKIPMGIGFVFQPEILYQVKGTTMDAALEGVDLLPTDLKIGYLEIPLQLQWGIDLVMVRPYVFAEPFFGVGLNLNVDNAIFKESDFDKANLKRIEYGAGFGAGIEIMDRFQISAKYFMNFGNLDADTTLTTAFENFRDHFDNIGAAFRGETSFNGLMFSLGIFF